MKIQPEPELVGAQLWTPEPVGPSPRPSFSTWIELSFIDTALFVAGGVGRLVRWKDSHG